MKLFKYISAVFLLIVIVNSCTTTPFSFVNKKLVGTWIRTPIIPEDPNSVQKWIFTEEGHLYLENTISDTVVISSTGSDPSSIYPDTVFWSVLQPMTKHYLYLEMPVPYIYRSPPSSDILNNDSLYAIWEKSYEGNLYFEKWEVIKINKKVLQISIEELCVDCGNRSTALNMNGSKQITFVRE